MLKALPGGMSAQVFLRRHWQKRPLLVRGALPGFTGGISRSALFALAARSDVESRLVQRVEDRWRVTHGPLSRSHFGRPGPKRRTLLASGVNHHHAPPARFLAPVAS